MKASRALFRFHPENAGDWQAVNDGVMGGISEGGVHITSSGTLLFHGTVSLESGGGFASIRSHPRKLATTGAAALRIAVRGDGRRYKLNLKTDEAFDGVQYQAAFVAPAGEWITLTLPFAQFAPVFRGRSVPDAPVLDPARIVTVGFLISDRQAGTFSLEIRSIEALCDTA